MIFINIVLGQIQKMPDLKHTTSGHSGRSFLVKYQRHLMMIFILQKNHSIVLGISKYGVTILPHSTHSRIKIIYKATVLKYKKRNEVLWLYATTREECQAN